MTRLFLDTSALFSAALSDKGASRQLILWGFQGRVRLFISSFVVEEAERNLSRKAPAALPALRAFLASAPFTILDPSPTQVAQATVFTEFKDAPIVAAAMKARAAYLVTFDAAHLLGNAQIEREAGLLIRTASDVLSMLQ